MSINRRTFLGGALALTAATMLPTPADACRRLPTIYGNGYDDDTEGLRALFAGLPVNIQECGATINNAHDIQIIGGSFVISGPVLVWREGWPSVMMTQNFFNYRGNEDGNWFYQHPAFSVMFFRPDRFPDPSAIPHWNARGKNPPRIPEGNTIIGGVENYAGKQGA